MANDQPSKEFADASTAAIFFPDAKTIFSVRLKPLNEIKASCLVVLDTNVLLVPYTINPKGLSEIANTYRKLVTDERLVIPAQVAREFAKNRPNKLTELYQQLTSRRSKVTPFQKGQYPLLEGLPAYTEVVELEKALDEKISNYKTALSKVLDHVRAWNWDDPVSILYGELFSPNTVIEAEISTVDLDSDLKRRQQHKIPPGYKDASKDDSGVGDILIWHTILELGRRIKKDVIFVSADGKPDWFHQSDGALYPRFELVDEYRRNADGASFHILKLSDFLDLFDVGEQVIQEVRQEEARLTHPKERKPNMIAGRSYSHDSVKSWLTAAYSEYRIEVYEAHRLDFVALGPNDKRFGIIIKTVVDPIIWKSRVIQMVERNVERALEHIEHVLVVIVADNEENAKRFGEYYSGKATENSCAQVCVGWLDDSYSFVPAFLLDVG
jgi:hypothetical protein